MGLKRIIAPERFNFINGCYIEDFVLHGHRPVYLMGEYYKRKDSDVTRTSVVVPKGLCKTMSCRGPFYIIREAALIERSPRLHLNYVSSDLWDAAINKILATWGKETKVRQLMTKNKDNLNVISWKQAHTEKDNRGCQLVLDSVDDIPWTECHYKTQRAAAGELWVDTCEYLEKKRIRYVSTCVLGSHAAA